MGDMDTLPAKLLMLARETDMDPLEAPMLKLTGVAEEMVKLPTCASELVAWNAVPGDPEPVIVTRYDPGMEEFNAQDPALVPLGARTICADVQITVRPVLGLEEGLRVTLPAKLKELRTVRKMEAPVAPELKLTEPVAEMVKSPTWTTELAE